MSGFNAVLFDLDGTLVDSAPGILQTFRYALWQFGVVLPEEKLRRFLGPPLRGSFAQVLAPEEVEQAVELYRGYYKLHGQEGCGLYPGARELLETLRNSGYTICIATSKARDVAQRVLAHYGIEDAVDYLGGASLDQSLDTKAAVIRHVLSQPLLAGKRAVMVGDRDNDMQGAAECGLPAVGVAYGYAAPGELEAYGPQYLAADTGALADWLLQNYG